MTTETKKASETSNDATTDAAPSAAPAAKKEEDQSVLPTVLAGAGILAVAALLIFWPSGDDSKGAGKDDAAAAGQADGGGAAGGAGGRAAGVGARPVDAATTPESTRRNPALQMPAAGRGMAPVPEALPKDPPATATPDEKIAFYEKRLEQAERVLETRKKFVDRLPTVQARVEQSKNPEEGMKAFEKRKQIVEDNYAKAQRDVQDIEGKLAELRGG